MKATVKAGIRGTLTMLGTIIGAGVFGMPFVFKTLGGLAGSAIFWALAAVVIMTHVLYAELIVHNAELRNMRLPGHVKRILGEWPAFLALISHPFNVMGACLAYIILGGGFLATLSGYIGLPAEPFYWQLLFWAAGAITVFFGWKIVARIESFMVWMLVTLLGFSLILFLPRIHPAVLLEANWGSVFIPFGIMLFALSGFTGVPEVVEISGRDRKRALRAVGFGSFAAAFLVWAFGLLAYAAAPAITSSPTDLVQAFPSSFFWLLPAVGFFSVAAAFIAQTEDLKSMIHFDMRLPAVFAWGVALGVPMLLFLFLQRDFLSTISFVGSIFSATNALLILFMSMAVRRHEKRRMPWNILLPFACAIIFSFAFIWRILILT